jgi:hypothetical protein
LFVDEDPAARLPTATVFAVPVQVVTLQSLARVVVPPVHVTVAVMPACALVLYAHHAITRAWLLTPRWIAPIAVQVKPVPEFVTVKVGVVSAVAKSIWNSTMTRELAAGENDGEVTAAVVTEVVQAPSISSAIATAGLPPSYQDS